MLTSLALVTVVAMTRHSSGEELLPTENIFAPAVENCTKNLLELLLWQHGFHVANLLEAEKSTTKTLETIASTLLEMKDLIKSEKRSDDDHNKTCTDPFHAVGSNCLLLAPQEQLTWAAARQYCTARGSDLAILKDANTFAEFLGFINSMNSITELQGVWIGGSDEEAEGVWKWVNGDLMPGGPPFWGSTNGYRPEPGGGRTENCGMLYKPDRHYLHDVACSHKAAPLCQK